MLTSGGDCQSLNATMRGVAKTLYANVEDVTIFGFEEGYRGLIYGEYRKLQSSDFSGILTEGGTILGTSRQPFKLMRTPDENGLDKVEAMKSTYRKLRLDCLVTQDLEQVFCHQVIPTNSFGGYCSCFFLFSFEPGTHYLGQAGLQLTEIHLPLPPKC